MNIPSVMQQIMQGRMQPQAQPAPQMSAAETWLRSALGQPQGGENVLPYPMQGGPSAPAQQQFINNMPAVGTNPMHIFGSNPYMGGAGGGGAPQTQAPQEQQVQQPPMLFGSPFHQYNNGVDVGRQTDMPGPYADSQWVGVTPNSSVGMGPYPWAAEQGMSPTNAMQQYGGLPGALQGGLTGGLTSYYPPANYYLPGGQRTSYDPNYQDYGGGYEF